ncbi:MAG: hypothetical protein ACRD59_14265 [Candidatus Acidiferrales bacterium]
MGLYGFKARFVPYVLAGTKTHTIRSVRAHPDKPGNVMHLYTGLRTKKAKLLMRVECVKVESIAITCEVKDLKGGGAARLVYRVEIDGIALDSSELEALARRDGFPGGWSEMFAFWQDEHDFPFSGHVIHWRKAGERRDPPLLRRP